MTPSDSIHSELSKYLNAVLQQDILSLRNQISVVHSSRAFVLGMTLIRAPRTHISETLSSIWMPIVNRRHRHLNERIIQEVVNIKLLPEEAFMAKNLCLSNGNGVGEYGDDCWTTHHSRIITYLASRAISPGELILNRADEIIAKRVVSIKQLGWKVIWRPIDVAQNSAIAAYIRSVADECQEAFSE